MNTEIILGLVSDYVIDGKLTYSAFDFLFNNEDQICLSKKEQYKIVNILFENGIELCEDNIENKYEQEEIEIDEFEEENNNSYDSGVQINNEYNIFNSNIFCDDEDYVEEFKGYQVSYKNLTNEKLCKLMQDGDDRAKNYLCYKNRKLVYKYARMFANKSNHKLTCEDLYQSGMIGMLKAAEKFNPSFNTKFSTYAVLWIRQSIKREIYDTGYTIRIPVHAMEKIEAISVANNDLYQQLCRVPSNKEIAEYYNETHEATITEDEVNKMLMLKGIYMRLTSIDAPIGEEQDTYILDLIPDNSTETPEEIFNKTCLKEQLEFILTTLTEREEMVIRLRYGLDDGSWRTLEEVGKIFGVTRERIRQIEEKALRKLRHPERKRKIADFINEK